MGAAAAPSTSYEVVDHSRDGTFVNGVRVHTAVALHHGDRVTLGRRDREVGFIYRVGQPGVATSAMRTQPHVEYQITVMARNALGWGPHSNAAIRVCSIEPSSPTNLRLKKLTPITALDTVDSRTPSSMTLT